MMKFTWVDSETGETDVNMFGANGQNDWEKGLGSALTYAERYFILKYFHIATDEDDIDNPDRVKLQPIKETSQYKVKQDMPELKPKTEQWEKVVQAIANGYTIEQVKQKYKISTSNEKILKIETAW